MKIINKQATDVFSQILKKMGKLPFIRLESPGIMPLTVEIINRFISTNIGSAALYSICHYHEENGVSMCDPEMRFIVIDCRNEPQELKKLLVIPQMFRQDNRGIDEESIKIENNVIASYWPAFQYDHCLFANQWLKNIQQQGFLK